MIKIGRTGITGITDNLLEELKHEFDEKKCIVLPELIEESMLDKILANIASTTFAEKRHITTENTVFAIDNTISSKSTALQQVTFLLLLPETGK